MANVGKKYADSVKLLEKNKLYDPAEALALVCQTSKAKFDETIEIHIRLGVDSRHADQQVRGAVVLPNGTGKTAKVLVFTKGDNVDKAKEAGAEYVGGLEFAEKIQKENWFEFDTVIASPDMMAAILNMTQFRDAAAGLSFHGTGKAVTPLGAKLLKSSAVGTGKLIGLDKSAALEMVKTGDVATEYDKLIDRQLERAVISCTAGFAKIFDGASKVLSV